LPGIRAGPYHFTPTSASWLNAVESFFATLIRRRLKRGVFRSVDELKAAIKRFIIETNGDPKPFVWTADPRRIIHEGDAEAVVKEKKEKALAEHVARHPEDVGRTVEDFNWIVRTIVRPTA
jgi:hypothetical protein